MSSTKRVNETDNYPKDSFEDRICDDLCEEILKWLNPIEKLKMAGVSKQFKRCLEPVRKRQKALRFLSKENSENIDYTFAVDNKIIPYNLPKLFNYFPNIETIHFPSYIKLDYSISKAPKIFFMIAMSCDRLNTIIGYRFYEYFSLEMYQRFIQKFAKQIKYLDMKNGTSGYEILENSKKLINLDIDFLKMFDGEKILVSNLQFASIDSVKDAKLFKIFVQHNPNLKSLTLRLNENVPQIIKSIAQLRKLTTLKIVLNVYGDNKNEVAEQFKAIAKNTYLQHLSLSLICFPDVSEFLEESLSTFTTLQKVILKNKWR